MAETPTTPQGPSADQRLVLYQQLVQALLDGQELTPEELQILAWGILQDPEVDLPMDLQELFNMLQQRQAEGQPVQAEEFEQAIAQADAIKPDEVAQAIQDSVVGGFVGAGTLAARAATSAGRAAAAQGIARGPAIMGSVLPGTSVSAVLKSLLRHPIKKAAIVTGGLMGYGALTQDPAATAASESERGLFKSFLKDRGDEAGAAATGPSAVAASGDTTQDIINQILQIVQPGQAGGALTPDIVALALELNIDPNTLQGSGYQTFTPANPLALGVYDFSPQNYPYGATSFGTVAAQPYTGEQTAEVMRLYQESVGSRTQPGFIQDRDEADLGWAMQANQGVVPPGGQIMPRAFQEYRGKSYLQHVIEAARRHGVPASLLYGIISLESNFNPNAVGDNGNSFGLVQLYLPAHPNITQRQALDPLFAINWAANNLRANFKKYGQWEAAVMAHNSPNAAQQFARTGTVADRTLRDKVLNYVGVVLDHATRSGIGNEVFTGEALMAGASGPAAPDMSAQQINNLKSSIRDLWTHWMGPGPADEAYLDQWANWLFSGKKGDDDLEQSIISLSTGRWPTKPKDITWTEWSTPFRSQIRSMLELPDLDNTDPLLTKVLNQSLESRDLEMEVRRDPRWQKTTNYRDQWVQSAMQIGQMFGFTAQG